MALLRGIRPLTLAVVLFLVLLFAHSGRYDQRWELVRESIRTGRLGLNSLSGLSSSSLAAQVFTVPDPKDLRENDKHAHQWYTEAKLRQLAACMATGTCPPNADKVVIFGCLHCHMAIFGKYMGGEGIW